MSKYKAVLHYDMLWDRNDLYIKVDNGYVSNIEITQSTMGLQTRPCMEGAVDFVQAIMDAGWKAGLKPAGYEDASRELTATKFHLEDMRLLARVKK